MKKFAKLLICLCLTCSFLFTGCSLVQRNTERYLNRIVASIGETTISKQELISAYNSYGYQYVENYSYTTEKAVKTTLDGLIDRKIILEKAKECIKPESTNEGTVMNYYDGGTKIATLFNANVWQNYVWKQVFDGINEQIATLETTVKTEKGIEDSSTTADETKTDYDPYKEYEKKVEYKDGVWSTIISPLSPNETKALAIGDFVQNDTGNGEISTIAWKRYLKQIVNSYKDKNLTVEDTTVSQTDFDAVYNKLSMTTDEKIAFLYELDRVQKIYDDNKYVSEFENIYEQYKQNSAQNFNVFNQKVVDYYTQLVNASYETYMSQGLENSYKAYVTAMQDDPSAVYYNRDYGTSSNGEKRAFVAVSHVLIKLSTEQTTQLTNLKTKLSTGEINQQQYDSERQKVLDATVVYARDDEGNETTVKKTVTQVYDEIKADLEQYSTVEEKAIAFNKYIYKYCQDTGIINATHYYAVNLDTTVDDKMVAEFADESRLLASENEDGGNLGEPVFVSQDSYSGFHIIFNAGVIKNTALTDKIVSLKSGEKLDYRYAVNLYNQKIMLGTNKTVYDYIYDTIFSSNYNAYQTSIVNTARQNLKVTYYVSAYKDLYE